MQILDLASQMREALERPALSRVGSDCLLAIAAPREQAEQEALGHCRGVGSLLLLFLLQMNSKGWLLFLEANTLLLFWFHFLYLDNHADSS